MPKLQCCDCSWSVENDTTLALLQDDATRHEREHSHVVVAVNQPTRRARRPRQWESPVVVTLTCNKQRVPESTVKATNIEEDMQGRDLLTFTCPACGETHKSYRLG